MRLEDMHGALHTIEAVLLTCAGGAVEAAGGEAEVRCCRGPGRAAPADQNARAKCQIGVCCLRGVTLD